MSSLLAPALRSLAPLDDADLDHVQGGGANWQQCAADALVRGTGGAVMGAFTGGPQGAGLGFALNAAGSVLTDPSCWDGQSSMAGAAASAIDGWVRGGDSGGDAGGPELDLGGGP